MREEFDAFVKKEVSKMKKEKTRKTKRKKKK